MVVVAEDDCSPLAYAATALICASVSVPENPDMVPCPLRTTVAICEVDRVLTCSDGPTPPCPLPPWQPAQRAAYTAEPLAVGASVVVVVAGAVGDCRLRL